MPYNRAYSLNDVHEILCASEGRLRPGVPIANAQPGHPITQHADGRADVLDKRYGTVILLHETIEQTRAEAPGAPRPRLAPYQPVRTDSRFLSRMDLIRAVYQALNSPEGQTKLCELALSKTVTINANLSLTATVGAEFSSHPVAKQGKKTVEAEGPSYLKIGTATKVRLVVDLVVPPTPDCAIHIHTAFPTEVS
jgi:hypothetical protein